VNCGDALWRPTLNNITVKWESPSWYAEWVLASGGSWLLGFRPKHLLSSLTCSIRQYGDFKPVKIGATFLATASCSPYVRLATCYAPVSGCALIFNPEDKVIRSSETSVHILSTRLISQTMAPSVSTAVAASDSTKNISWRTPYPEMWRRVALVRTHRLHRQGEKNQWAKKTLAVTCNRSALATRSHKSHTASHVRRQHSSYSPPENLRSFIEY
jgi:hypothetical protein